MKHFSDSLSLHLCFFFFWFPPLIFFFNQIHRERERESFRPMPMAGSKGWISLCSLLLFFLFVAVMASDRFVFLFSSFLCSSALFSTRFFGVLRLCICLLSKKNLAHYTIFSHSFELDSGQIQSFSLFCVELQTNSEH